MMRLMRRGGILYVQGEEKRRARSRGKVGITTQRFHPDFIRPLPPARPVSGHGTTLGR